MTGPAASSPPRTSARIGARSGLGGRQAEAAKEKRAAADKRLSRATIRSIAIGVGVGVAIYLLARVVVFAR